MAVLDLFSKRSKRQRGGSEVYTYNALPKPLRGQIIHIWREALGNPAEWSHDQEEVEGLWSNIARFLRKEFGVFALNEVGYRHREWEVEVAQFFMDEPDVERALDVVEVVFRVVDGMERTGAVAELNTRFKEHSVGYQFENGKIVRVDSRVAHEEVVKPALALLADPVFAGPNQEFLRAHEHHRHGREEECLVDCLKAFESTMKVICDRRGWPYETTATASKLIKVVFDNKLLPDHLQSEFTGLRAMLESGVPTVRNKTAGHGQGAQVRQVPGYLAAFVLHSTAANILLLVAADRALT